MMPFALNEATKYISPTKTPEFLAAGKPVVSTSIRDVVYPYGKIGLVSIADTAEEFESAIADLLAEKKDEKWLKEADELLESMSWNDIWSRMNELINKSMKKNINHQNKSKAYV